MSHLWLSLVLILLSRSTPDLKADFTASLYLFVVVLCKVMFSLQINDICDRKEDNAEGKKRWINMLPKSIGVLISTIFIAIGFTIVILASGSIKVIAAYTATTLLGLFYSLKPIRFKERGILGIFVYALTATTIYVLVPWTWLNSSLILLFILFIAVMSDKWVQLHFHQIIDYQADYKNGIRTYAVRLGLKRTRSSLQAASFFASLSLVILLIYIVFFMNHVIPLKMIIVAVSTSVVAAAGAYVKNLKKKKRSVTDLVRELPGIYLGLTYLLFYVLPPIGFFFLALKEPLIWVLVILSAFALFGQSFHSIRYKYS